MKKTAAKEERFTNAKLLESARRLVELLENPEGGCLTWHEAVHQRIDEIAAWHKDEE